MKHLRILEYVDEVARCGSIRKAADRLNVTSSAVNRRIMDLEEELGAPLFERRPRGVRLTAAGEVFVNYLRHQDGEVERMKSQIEDLKGMRRGTVRIACSQALALEFLPSQIGEFRKRHPFVSFEIKVFDHEQAISALAAYEVDLALVFRPPFLANFQPLMVLEQRIIAVMSAEHPLAARRTVRLRDCAAYPVALPERSIGGRQLLEEALARHRIAFQVAAEFELVRNVARTGAQGRPHLLSNPDRHDAGRKPAWPCRPRHRRSRFAPSQPGVWPIARPQSPDPRGNLRRTSGARAGSHARQSQDIGRGAMIHRHNSQSLLANATHPNWVIVRADASITRS